VEVQLGVGVQLAHTRKSMCVVAREERYVMLAPYDMGQGSAYRAKAAMVSNGYLTKM
jgi:hypothetical protein